eukprot:Hpha_TRINITY_DN15395_c0_g9::TRINITY_DN15395_c0_g9_i1::g.89773::m.89773
MAEDEEVTDFDMIADSLIDLAVGGDEKRWTGEDLEEAIEQGALCQPFRSIVDQLVQELTGVKLDTARELGFYKSVKLTLNPLGCKIPLQHLQQDRDTRQVLIEYLVAEVQANRMLETDKLESIGEDTAVTELDRSDKMVNTGLKAIAASMGYTNNVGTSVLKKLKVEIGPLIQKTLEQGSDLLRPLVREEDLAEAQRDTVTRLNQHFFLEYTTRRAVMLKRLNVTLLAFQWSEKKGLDLFSLKGRSDALHTSLSAHPSVHPFHLFTSTRLSLLQLDKKVCGGERKGLLKSKHKTHVIGKPPDRGGRTNTYNFESKVDQDISRANMQLRGDSHKGGKGGAPRMEDWNCPRCGASCFGSKPSCFKCGTQNPALGGKGGGGGGKGGKKGGGYSAASHDQPYGGASYGTDTVHHAYGGGGRGSGGKHGGGKGGKKGGYMR